MDKKKVELENIQIISKIEPRYISNFIVNKEFTFLISLKHLQNLIAC